MKGAEVLFVGFEGTRPTPEERSILRRLQPAGITLVPRNIEDEPGLRALLAELRLLCPAAIFGLDAEGGRVDRLRNLVGPAPAARDLAAVSPRRSARAGRWVGEALRNFGFDLDFAPVVDLDHGQRGNALDGRCLGRNPRAVTARARAFLGGLHRAGIGGCLKHFPGLGAAPADTHFELARVLLTRRRLARDLAPFVALAGEVEAVMVGHAIYPTLDPSFLPASLSPTICGGLLRKSLTFRGPVLSDDLEMGALGAHGDLPWRAEAALVAGCDGLLFCRQLGAAPEIARRLAGRRLDARRRQAEARLARLRRALERRRRQAGEPLDLGEVRRQLAALARPPVSRRSGQSAGRRRPATRSQ